MLLDSKFDTLLSDLDLDSRSQGCMKAKNFSANHPFQFSVDLNGIWYAVDTVSLMKIMLF